MYVLNNAGAPHQLSKDVFVTLQASDSMITVCSLTHSSIYILDTNGKVIQKLASKMLHGGLGQFHKPIICQGGFDGSILVSDHKNEYLQVRNVNMEWGMLALNERIRKPSGAAFYKRQLFVTQTTKPFMLLKFV